MPYFYTFVFPSLFISGINKRTLTSYLLYADILYSRKYDWEPVLYDTNRCKRFLFLMLHIIFPQKWRFSWKAQFLNGTIKFFYSVIITCIHLFFFFNYCDNFEKTNTVRRILNLRSVFLLFTTALYFVQIFLYFMINSRYLPISGIMNIEVIEKFNNC